MRHLLMLSLLTAWAASGCGDAPVEDAPPQIVRVEPARAESLAERTLATASLEAVDWQPLYFQQSGVAARVAVAEGALATAGLELARLDTAWQENQVALNALKVQAAELDLAQARHDLEQTRAMAASQARSPEQVYDAEQRALEEEIDLAEARQNLYGQQIKLEQMILRAPFDGLVAEVNLRVGDKVQGSVSDPDNDQNTRPPMAVFQPGRFQARLGLTEAQARGLRVGDPARIALMESPDAVMDGAVRWIAPSVDRDSRTVAVEVALSLAVGDAGFDAVRDGSTARVELLPADGRASVTVPERSLRYHRDRAYIFRLDRGQLERIEVKQGRVRGGRVEVTGDVAAGDRIVTDRVYAIEHGQAAREST